jgi:hypothetical protein
LAPCGQDFFEEIVPNADLKAGHESEAGTEKGIVSFIVIELYIFIFALPEEEDRLETVAHKNRERK